MPPRLQHSMFLPCRPQHAMFLPHCPQHVMLLPRCLTIVLLWMLVAFGLLLGGCSHTEQTTAPEQALPVAAEPAADEPQFQATDKPQLDIGVFTTLQYEAADFYYHSPTAFPPSYQEQQTVFSGQSVLLVITARDFATSENNHANLSYRITFIEPDGTQHSNPQETADRVLYRGEVGSPKAMLFPRNPPLIYFKEGRPTGTYTLRVTVRDNLSGQEQTIERPVSLRAYQPPTLPENFNPIQWLETYYQRPTPELALPALYLLGSLTARTWPPHLQNDYSNPQARLVGFYDRLLTDNPWLLPHFAQAHSRALYLPDDHPRNLRPQIELVLRTHLRRFSQRPQGVPQRLWNQCRSPQFISASDGPPSVLDATGRERLWGEFFASGDFAPLYQLSAASTLYPTLDANARRIEATLARLKRNGQAVLLPSGAINSLDARAQAALYTLWSLHKQAQNHPLVQAYVQNIIEYSRRHNPEVLAYISSDSTKVFDERALELLAALPDADALRAAGLPPINTTPDLHYLMLRDNHSLLRDSYDHHDDLLSEDPELRTEQLTRLDNLAEASAATLLQWQEQVLLPHRITPAPTGRGSFSLPTDGS